MRTIITSVLLFFSNISWSQTVLLSGSIRDSSSNPVSGVTVAIYKAGNTKTIKKVLSDSSGKFTILIIDSGLYFMQTESLGYQTFTSPAFFVHGNENKIQLQTWTLNFKATALNEVTVTSNKQLVKNMGDKIIYNVQDDKSLTGLSGLEAISRMPFVSVDGLGNVQLKGQNNFKLLLNGRSTSLFASSPGEALKAFPVSTISTIEVITTPSAKYEGEGLSGIINIITNKKTVGFNASTSFTYSSIEKGNINPNNRLSLKIGKIAINSFVYYAENLGYKTTGFTMYQSLVSSSAFNKRKSLDTLFNQGYQFGANTELAYDIDSLQSISIYSVFSGSGGARNQKKEFTMTDIIGNDLQHSIYFTSDKDKNPGSEIGIDYSKKLINTRNEFTLAINRQLRKGNTEFNSSQYNNPGTSLFLQNNNKARNEQVTIQSDFTMLLRSKSTVEMGVNLIFRKVNSDFSGLYKLNINDPYIPDNTNTDVLSYKQQVWGCYGVFTYKQKSITFKVGSRLEQTKVYGDFVSSQTTVQQQYYSLLPSVSFNWQLKNNKQLTLSYNRRLSRPGLVFLNPFVDNRDPLYINYGNPLLKPEFSNTFAAGFSGFRNKLSYNLSLQASVLNSAIQRYFIFDVNTGITRQTYGNIGQSRLYGLSGFISYRPNSKWNYSLNYNLNYADLMNSLNIAEKNSGWYGSISHALSFTISEKWFVFHNTSYSGAPIQIQGRNGNFLFYNLGAGHFLMQKKIILSLSANNIINKAWPITNEFKSSTFSQSTEIQRPVRSFSLTIRYNYGKLKQNISRKKGVTINDTKENVNN